MKTHRRTMLERRRRKRRPTDHAFLRACRALALPPGIYPRTMTIMLAGLV